MFGFIKSAFCGVSLALALAVGAQAAPISYTVSGLNASIVGTCTDGFCNADLDELSVSGVQSVDTGETDVFNVFTYDSRVSQREGRNTPNETINIALRVILTVGGTAYTYISNGFISNWTVAVGNGNITSNPFITWTSQVIPAGSPLAVVFGTALTRVQGNGEQVRSAFSVTQASVVPLPGGVVLLLTGLLGLFGLSRRRRAIA